ncbi:MAG: fibronectin type III domain-containing protein [Bacteroidales bacterium]|nr:fibronectin type III domain-containing protein [Bacteroidales bacterium]
MKKVFRFLLGFVFFIALMPQLNAQTVVTVGNNCMGEDFLPINVTYGYSYSQTIFSSEELMAGEISSISYKFNSEVPVTISSQIYLGEVNKDVFANPEDFVSADSLTQVYSGNVTFTQGWVTINFTTPFDYSGENNLVVAYMNNTGTFTDARFFTTCSSVGNKTITCYRSNQEISINNPQEVNSSMRIVLNNRPNVKFEINPFSASCYPPTEILSQQISSQSATFTWNAVEGVEQYAVAYKKSSEVLWDTTFVNTNSITLSQLDVITPYDMKIWSVCSDEESIAFTTSFTTLPNEELISELPFVCEFHTQAESQLWTIQNGTQTNKWHWGNIVNSTLSDIGGVSGAMYISDNNGLANNYDGNSTSTVYFSRYIQFNDAPEFKLTFDWKGIAEGNSDYLQVFLLPTTTQLDHNMVLTSGEITDRLGGANDWKRQEVVLSREYANGVYNLVFCWRNDNTVEHNPPIAVDNISIEAVNCGRVTEIYSEINDGENISATIYFGDANTNEERTYIVEYSLTGTGDWESVETQIDSVVIEDLLASSNYSVRVKVLCSSTEVSDYSHIHTFNTPCGTITQFPIREGFEQEFVLEQGHIGDDYSPKCWEVINGASSYYGFERSGDCSSEGNNSLNFSGSATSGTYNDWLITPPIEFNGNQRMTFKIRKSSSNSTLPHFKVYYYDAIEQDITSLGDTSLFQVLDTVYCTHNTLDFKKMEVDLSSIVGEARVALVVNERTSSFYLDELTIENSPSCPDVYGVVAKALSSTSMSVDFDANHQMGWTIAYGQADSIQNFNPQLASQFSVNPNDSLPVIINNLTSGIYYVAVKSNCEDGAYSEIETVEIPFAQNLPYTQNFDSLNINGWDFVSNSVNSWIIGSEVNEITNQPGNALYISNGNGYNYTLTTATTAYASLNVAFGEYPAFNLSFDWKAAGQGTVDYAKVYILPWDYELTTSLPNDSYSLTGRLNQQTQWQTENIELDHQYANGIYKIVFAWKNNSSGGTNPPIAIDNISIVPLTCGGVEGLTLNNMEGTLTTTSVAVSFNDYNTENVQYQIEYKTPSETEWTIAATTDTNYYLINNLNYQTDYQVRVAVVCSNGELTSYAQEEITTPCGTITQLPWQEQFSTGIGECWYQMLGEISDTITHASDLLQNNNGWKYNIYVGGERIYADLSYESAKYWIISPSFYLGEGDTIYQLSADVFRTSLNGTGVAPVPNGDMFAILVSTDDGLTWNTANALIFGSGETSNYDYNLSAFSSEASRVNFKLANENDQPLTGAIRFAFYGEGSTSRMLVDNIEISQWQPCQTPSMVNVANITSNSAELTFLDFGQSQQWEYALQQGNTIDFATAQTQTITYQGTYLNDLLDGMTYSVAVRSVCSEGEYSSWSEIITFTTPSQPTPLPFETTFSDIYDNQKWEAVSNTNINWTIGYATFSGEEDTMSAYISSNGTDYSVAMPGGWNYTYTALYREFDFGAGGNYTLSFDYKVSGYDFMDAGLHIFVKDENDVIIAEYYNMDQAIANYVGVNQWTRANIELPSDIEGIKKIVFYSWGYISSYSTQSQVPPAIDNLVIEEMICNPPTNLTVSNITENSATLSWEGTADNYKINYVVAGSSDTLTQITSNTTYTLGLNSFENYQVSVQSVCEEDLYSLPTPTLSFSTLQDADTIPYTCNFETPGNNGWLLRNGSCVNQWVVGFPTSGTSNSLFISDDEESAHYTANANSVVIAEKLFQFSNSEYITISFDLTIGGEITSNIFYDYLKVFLLPATQTLEPTTAYDLSGEYSYAMADYAQDVILQHLGTNAICLLEGTQTINITIPTPINEQRKLVFLWRNNNMSGTQPGAIIDNISITTLGGVIEEECLAPTNVEVSQITSNSALVTWTPQGNETAWQVKLNQGEVIDVTTPSYTLTNLLPATEYDFMVRTNCGTGVSEWVSATFTTTDTIIAPTVTTLPATAITQTTAVLNAEITEGNVEILTKGFYYKETANAIWDSIAVEGQTEISVTLSDLLPQTTYSFKAFITTENALIQGEELTFTTDESSLSDVENTIEVNLYPNPAKEKVYLETKGFENKAKAMLSDLQGRILKEIEINSERIEINLNTLSSGVYYLKVFDNNSTKTIKIIKE